MTPAHKKNQTPSLLQKIFTGEYHPFLFIILLGVLLYGQTLFFGFIHFDDVEYIHTGQFFLQDLGNLVRTFFDSFSGINQEPYYRPTFFVSLIFDAQIGGMKPLVYHVTNLLLHLLNSCLLFVFLQELGHKKPLAFASTLLFVVHPALASTAIWIPGRTTSLLTLFALGSFISLLRYQKNPTPENQGKHFIFFFFALLSKESALALLPLYGVFVFFCSEKKTSKKHLFSLLLGWLLVGGFWFFLRHHATTQSNLDLPIKNIFFSLELYTLPVFLNTLGKILVPFEIGLFSTALDMSFLWGILALLVLGGLLFVFPKRNRSFVVWGLLWFSLLLFPSILSGAVTGDLFEFILLENRIYLPLIGLLVVLLELKPLQSFSFAKKNHALLFAGLFSLLAFLNITSRQHLKNPLSFWEHAVTVAPSSAFAHNNLGTMYLKAGREDLAYERWQHTILLDSARPSGAYGNLGFLFLKQGKQNKAEDFFKKDLDINPTSPSTLFNLGSLYYQMKDTQRTIDVWTKGLDKNPRDTRFHNSLGTLYYQLGNVEQARNYWEKGLDIDKHGYSDVRKNLAVLYTDEKKFLAAERILEAHLRTQPYDVQALLNLGSMYYQWGKIDQAQEAWKAILSIDPFHTQAQNNLRATTNIR